MKIDEQTTIANPAYLNLDKIKIDGSVALTEVVTKFNAKSAEKSAVIIGAGPSGLATGIVLRNQGWKVLIVEGREVFSRSNVIGINKAALAWFKKYDLLDELLCTSSKTSQYPQAENFPRAEDILTPDNWLINSETTNTLTIKSLQVILAKHFKELGGDLLINTNVEINKSSLSLNKEYTILTDDLNLVIVADGARSLSRKALSQLYLQEEDSMQRCTDVPTQHWVNVIISPKPVEWQAGIYFSEICNNKGKFSAATSVSDHDLSLNFQTSKIDDEAATETVKRIIQETAEHMRGRNIAENATYYVINRGRVTNGYALTDLENVAAMENVIVKSSSKISKKMVFNDKFILIGDAKGVSSPKAGLGASLALAFDPTIIEQHATGKLSLTEVEKYLQSSAKTWVQKAKIKLELSTPNSSGFFTQRNESAEKSVKLETNLDVTQVKI